MATKLHVTQYTVGQWDGWEQLAAWQFNSIIDALAIRFTGDNLDERVNCAWKYWGKSSALLSLTIKQVQNYASSI
jgi:hypothetical protein